MLCRLDLTFLNGDVAANYVCLLHSSMFCLFALVPVFFEYVIPELFHILADCPDFKIDVVYNRGDSVSDVLLSLLLIIPRNNFTEFTNHPAQYFMLFHNYAGLGSEQV